MDAYSHDVTTAESDAKASGPTCVSYTPGMHVIGSFMCLLIAASNLLTIVTLLKVKEKVGAKNRLYVISVAFADLLLAPAFGLELILSQMGYLCDQEHAPVNININVKRYILSPSFMLRIMSFQISLFTLFSIGVDRILAVSKPIWYKTHVSCFRIKIVLATNWIYHIALSGTIMTYYAVNISDDFVRKVYNFDTTLPPYMYNFIILPQAYLIAMPGNVISYCITYRKIKQQFEKKGTDSAKNKDLERTGRFFRMMLVTLVMLAILYVPFMVGFKMFGIGKPGKPKWVYAYFGQPVALILMSNSWINPILYACYNRDYRRAYFNILGCSAQNKVDNQDMNSTSATQGTTGTGLN